MFASFACLHLAGMRRKKKCPEICGGVALGIRKSLENDERDMKETEKRLDWRAKSMWRERGTGKNKFF